MTRPRITSRTGFVAFGYEEVLGSAPESLILYCGRSEFSGADLVRVLRDHAATRGRLPSSLVVFAPEFRRAAVRSALRSDSFIECWTENGFSEPLLACFGADGRIDGALSERDVSKILHSVLTDLFVERGGLLESTSAVHYIKPSQRHTDRFLRTGNVLQRSAEIEIIAWACLSRMPEQFGYVYTDTGAINVVACEVRNLLRQLRGAAEFTIDSFNSYGGLKEFEPAPPSDSWWLISASTSNGLVEEIREKHQVPADRITTLFTVSVPNSPTIVCRLDRRTPGGPGVEPISSFSSVQCQLCAQGSSPLRLTDDQFTLSEVRSVPYLPREVDLPESSRRSIARLIDAGAVRAFYQEENVGARSKEIFFDLEPILLGRGGVDSSRELVERLGRRVRQSGSSSATHVIHLRDRASKALAHYIADRVGEHRAAPPVVISRDELTKEVLQKCDSIIVACSTLATGASLVDVSRRIRAIEGVSAVVYVVWLSRTTSHQEQVDILKDICFGSEAAQFDCHVVETVALPAGQGHIRTSWDDERHVLRALSDECGDVAARELIEARLSVIDDSQDDSRRGLVDNVFWPSTSAQRLSLTPGFVFLPSALAEQPERVSQADVLFVVSALLHRLRTHGIDPPLAQHPLLRRTIDVGTFYRFSDPVIQAAFLRASHAGELDYSADPRMSQGMLLLLTRILNEHETSFGAPAIEFALMLATGRLRLTDDDVATLSRSVRRPLHPVLDQLLEKVFPAGAERGR